MTDKQTKRPLPSDFGFSGMAAAVASDYGYAMEQWVTEQLTAATAPEIMTGAPFPGMHEQLPDSEIAEFERGLLPYLTDAAPAQGGPQPCNECGATWQPHVCAR